MRKPESSDWTCDRTWHCGCRWTGGCGPGGRREPRDPKLWTRNRSLRLDCLVAGVTQHQAGRNAVLVDATVAGAARAAEEKRGSARRNDSWLARCFVRKVLGAGLAIGERGRVGRQCGRAPHLPSAHDAAAICNSNRWDRAPLLFLHKGGTRTRKVQSWCAQKKTPPKKNVHLSPAAL